MARYFSDVVADTEAGKKAVIRALIRCLAEGFEFMEFPTKSMGPEE